MALWPDETVVEELVAVRDRAVSRGSGKAVDPHNLHITLAFLGATDARQQQCAEACADRITVPPFTLILDSLGYFPRPRVLWAGSEQTPAPLSELVTMLRQGLAGCGFDLDERPFRPHVTLLRKVRPRPKITPRLDRPIEWQVGHFHLVQSITHAQGAEYRIIKSWVLS